MSNKYTKIVASLALLVLVIGMSYLISSYIQRLFYPRNYGEYVEAYAKEYDVPEYIVYSVIKVESDFDKDAVSEKGACGLMQLMPDTYGWLVQTLGNEEKDIFDPEENIKYGTYYLGMLYNRYEDWSLALCAYNAGMGNVDNWLKEEPFEIRFIETQYYVNKLEVVIDKYQGLYYR